MSATDGFAPLTVAMVDNGRSSDGGRQVFGSQVLLGTGQKIMDLAQPFG